MVGDGDVTDDSPATSQSSNSRKLFWRSASWSASRTSPLNPGNEERDSADQSISNRKNIGRNSRCSAVPLTPRSQNGKARGCLPPLQPLSIARHSLDEWPRAGSDDLGEWPDPPTPSGNRNGERLKLDLSSIQRNPEKNSGLVKRDKIALFDKVCSKVGEHVYVGGDAVAKDREILKQNGITHILNCVGFACPENFKSDFVYRTLWLQDNPSEDITSVLYDVFDYFEDVRDRNGRVFVHCCQGVSRSTSLVIAYMMWKKGQSFDDAFQCVKAARGIADPNMGFSCQLLQCQKRILGHPLSPSSLLRIYRMAPHSPYDPLHLVPKMLNDPSLSALDSRGAFIIHVPCAIYIWIGKNCDSVMEKDSEGAVCQIVRYERAQGPVLVIREGEEPPYFWDAFVNLLPLMDKSLNNSVLVEESRTKIQPGKRKVDSYDVDFEIFQIATKGGFLPSFASSHSNHETHLPARESSWRVPRHKGPSGVIKDVMSLPKISLSRAYSDSMMIGHSSSPSSSLSTSSSPFLSPDSMSSDTSSSSNCHSEASLGSPSAAPLSSFPASSPMPEISNLSLHPSVACQVSSQLKKVTSSLAERRGTLSKTLKLPGQSVSNSPSNIDESRKDSGSIYTNSYTVCKPDSIEIVFGPKDCIKNGEMDSIRNCKTKESLLEVDKAKLCSKETSSFGHVREADLHRELPGSEFITQVEDNDSKTCESVHYVGFYWPSMEKITKLNKHNLDSRSTVVVFSPGAGIGRRENRILYIWIGSSFGVDSSHLPSGLYNALGDVDEINWIQVGDNVLTQMGLPKETRIQIIREEEEEAKDFLALWSSTT